jgi:hypothetical protein
MANGVQLEMAEPTAGDQIPPAHAPRAFGRFLVFGVTSSIVNKYYYFEYGKILSRQKQVSTLTFPQRSHVFGNAHLSHKIVI